MIEVVLCKRDGRGNKVLRSDRVTLKGSGPWISNKVDKLVTQHLPKLPEDDESQDFEDIWNAREDAKDRFYGTQL